MKSSEKVRPPLDSYYYCKLQNKYTQTFYNFIVCEVTDGDKLYSIRLYIAENKDAMNLVEGERVYVLEHSNDEWWYVKKHLTEEKGWVPAPLLKDEQSYAIYVQKKLHEKIDKLPIFESEYFTPVLCSWVLGCQ